jgi:hypothetical protein
VPKWHLVVQLAIGVVFLLSSGGKLRDRGSFINGLAAYRIVPASWVKMIGLFIIGLESFLAAAHLTGHLLRLALPVGLGLIATFGVAVAVNIKRDRALPCYCFGDSASIISGATLIRLGFLAAGEMFLLELYQPVYPLRMAPADLGFAFFWSILLLVASLWLFALGDVARLVKV